MAHVFWVALLILSCPAFWLGHKIGYYLGKMDALAQLGTKEKSNDATVKR